MKKISSFLPDNVINKNLLITKLNEFVAINFPNMSVDNIKVVNIKDGTVIIGCKNSSLATILKFEKNKDLEVLKNNKFLKITDLKIIVDS